MDIFNNIKIVNLIKQGSTSSVYKVLHNKKHYALKIWKIFQEDIDNKTFPLHREIKFYKYIESLTNREQDFFCIPIYFKIVKNCDYNHDKIIKDIHELKTSLTSEDKFCCFALYDIVDHTFDDFKYEIIRNGNIKNSSISDKHYISLVMQLVYTMYIMKKGGWNHNDLHAANIGFMNTKDSTVTFEINKKKYTVKTYGRKIKLLDFGLAFKDGDEKLEKDRWTLENNDFLFLSAGDILCYKGFIHNEIDRTFYGNPKDQSYLQYNKQLERFQDTAMLNIIFFYCNTKKDYHNISNCFELCSFLNVRKFYECALGKYYDENRKYLESYKYISDRDLLELYSNSMEIEDNLEEQTELIVEILIKYTN